MPLERAPSLQCQSQARNSRGHARRPQRSQSSTPRRCTQDQRCWSRRRKANEFPPDRWRIDPCWFFQSGSRPHRAAAAQPSPSHLQDAKTLGRQQSFAVPPHRSCPSLRREFQTAAVYLQRLRPRVPRRARDCAPWVPARSTQVARVARRLRRRSAPPARSASAFQCGMRSTRP